MDVNHFIDEARHKEVAHWKGKFKRTVRLCKAIWEERRSIEDIKFHLGENPWGGVEELGASQLWNELDYPVQKLLITAPRFGGPFTTAEVKKIKELWEISADDL